MCVDSTFLSLVLYSEQSSCVRAVERGSISWLDYLQITLAWTAFRGNFLRLNKKSLNQKPGTQKPASSSHIKSKEFGN